jgi:hypothetical protein
MNFLKSYLSHLSGYVISAATIVSTLSPGTFPPKYAFVTAVATFVATAFSHGQTVQANAGSIVSAVAKAATDAVNSAAAGGVAKLFVGAVAAGLLFGLHGCASVQSFIGSPTGQTVVVAGVQVGVTTAEQKGVTAAQINSVAKAVLAADTGVSATVTTLTATVNSAAQKAGVPPGDIIAFQVLETAFDAYLVAKYGSNSTVANVQADVALFCNTVIADTGG